MQGCLLNLTKRKAKSQTSTGSNNSNKLRGVSSHRAVLPLALIREIPLINSGARMLYNTQDMLWRRKLEEQADLQQALELHSRRLTSLQLLDVKKHHHRALSTGSPLPSPTRSPNIFNQSLAFPPLHSNTEVPRAISV
ncbi:hypothetical protein OIU78_009225, partial [Salix suchowensis]